MALKQVVIDNFHLLRRSINPSPDLLAKLRSVEIVEQRLASIKQQPALDDKNNALLDALLDVPDDLQETVMNGIIEALRWSDQDHVANIFRPQSDVFPMSDEHYNIIMNKRQSLRQFINPRDGLVDRLVSSLVFSVMDGNSVLSKSQEKVEEMADETVTILVRKSDSAFDKFVNSLNETGQSHVAYLLTGIGPPPMSDQHRELLLEKMHELCKFIDVENGLLKRLVSGKVISLEDVREIRSVPDDNVMAEKLVLNLLRKRDDAFHDFVESLNYTGQMHVSYILTGEGDCRPLKDELRNTLLSGQRDQAVKTINSKNSGLISALMSRRVFTSYDEQRVVNVRPDTHDDRNEMILNLVARKSQSDFFNFISALHDSDDTHAVVILIGVEVVTKIKAVFDSEAAAINLPNVDSELLRYMLEMFESNGTVMEKLNEILSKNGVAVSDIREGCIQITFTCKSLESLKRFQDLCRSGELDSLLTEAFCPQFADQGLKSIEVVISDEQFENCATIFDRSVPMTSGHRDALESSAEWLVSKLRVSADLMDELSLRGRRRRAIETAATREEQVMTMLDIVSRQPDSAFTQLLNALTLTGQHEVAEYILAKSQGSAETAGGELQDQAAATMQADVNPNVSPSSKVFRGLFAHNIIVIVYRVIGKEKKNMFRNNYIGLLGILNLSGFEDD